MVQVLPACVTSIQPLDWRRGLGRIALEPCRNVEIVELLRPQHAGKGRALDNAPARVGNILLERGIELVGFRQPVGENAIESNKGLAPRVGGPQAKPDARAGPGRKSQAVMESATCCLPHAR